MPKPDNLTKTRIVEAVVETNGYTQIKVFETVEIMLELIKRSLETGDNDFFTTTWDNSINHSLPKSSILLTKTY